MRTPDKILEDVGIDYKTLQKENPLLYKKIRRAMDDFADQYVRWKLKKYYERQSTSKVPKKTDDKILYSTSRSNRR